MAQRKFGEWAIRLVDGGAAGVDRGECRADSEGFAHFVLRANGTRWRRGETGAVAALEGSPSERRLDDHGAAAKQELGAIQARHAGEVRIGGRGPRAPAARPGPRPGWLVRKARYLRPGLWREHHREAC